MISYLPTMSSNNPYADSMSKDAPGVSNDSPQPPAETGKDASSDVPLQDTNAGGASDKSEAEKEADRLYEERIEEEYAKREGGA